MSSDNTSVYSSASYASRVQTKSIFSSDARIFHQAEFIYDTVERIHAYTFVDQIFTATVSLRSGEHATFRLLGVTQSMIRLQLYLGTEPPPATSTMLVSIDNSTNIEWQDGAVEIIARFAGYRLVIQKDPFTLEVFCDSRSLLGLEREVVAGEYVALPLGFRRFAAKSEAFISWHIHNGEYFFGLGEKFNKVEKTSTRATIWAADTCGSNTTDMSYKSLPLLYSTDGWGMMLHHGHRSFWEVASFSYTSGSALVEADYMDAFLFFAPTLKGLIGHYTTLTGRPQMPPTWALGTWMSRCAYRNRAEVEGVVARMIEEEIPFNVIHLDPPWMKSQHYHALGVDACDFIWDDEAWPDKEDMIAALARQGVKVCLWINPYIAEESKMYHEAQAAGYLVQSTKGRMARLEYGQTVGIIDLTNPAAATWWGDHLRELMRLGVAVFKPDYGDRVPEDALFANGKVGTEMHNLFMFEYTRIPYQIAAEMRGVGFVWRRSGYLGSQRYQGSWAGDTQVSWEGMRGALRGGLSAAFGGETLWGHDIGGFVGDQPDPEIYIRWMQLGFFSPLTRFHGTSPREPWTYGEVALAVAKHYAQWRYRMIPYLLACLQESVETGVPLMRHLKLEFQAEPGVENIDDQFMLGPDLLVAPIMQPGQTSRFVYLPTGTWYAFEDQGQAYEGGRYHHINAPLERIPVFIRSSAVIPCMQQTLMPFQNINPSTNALMLTPGIAERHITFFQTYGDTLHCIYTCDGRRGVITIESDHGSAIDLDIQPRGQPSQPLVGATPATVVVEWAGV